MIIIKILRIIRKIFIEIPLVKLLKKAVKIIIFNNYPTTFPLFF